MLAITWIGHATVLIELDGTRLLTDPVLGGWVGPLRRIAPPVDGDAIGAIDCVLLSHLHADHADVGSLRALGAQTRVLAPSPSARWLTQRDVGGAEDIQVGESASVGEVRVAAVPATHDGKRAPFGPAPDPIGFVISGSRSVYFAGDTDLFDEMASLRGQVDVALLPVAGWGPNLGPGHLDPSRAAQAVGLIRPAVAIPIHYGTLAPGWALRRPADPGRPAREFESFVARDAGDVTVRLLAPGERAEL